MHPHVQLGQSCNSILIVSGAQLHTSPPAEIKYSTFDRELLAVYLAIKHFRHFIEGRQFKVFTDHKPLTFSLASHSNHYTPRQIRHLDYISQFTTDIQYIIGSSNPVADAIHV